MPRSPTPWMLRKATANTMVRPIVSNARSGLESRATKFDAMMSAAAASHGASELTATRWRRASPAAAATNPAVRSEEHTSELQSRLHLVCRLLLEKNNYSSTEWSAAKMGPKRDVIGELAQAVKGEGLVFGASSHRAEHWWFFDGGMTFDSDVKDSR